MTEPEDTDIQRLIRLKRYEQPPEGFVDDFMVRFHHRQRSEILQQSSLSLFWDRLSTFMDGRLSPGMGLAGAAAAVLILGGSVFLLPHGSPVGSVAAAQPAPHGAGKDESFTTMPYFKTDGDHISPQMRPEQMANLMSEHFHGGYADEQSQLHRVSGLLDEDVVGHVWNAPLIDVEQNGSAKNIQRQ
ncbi:MAG: hypothetical protein JWO94_1092 [Verrucomicrobiaceae bacterium]|nr:hypothetical protein [Verrucomicrobiaceae bacterium]